MNWVLFFWVLLTIFNFAVNLWHSNPVSVFALAYSSFFLGGYVLKRVQK